MKGLSYFSLVASLVLSSAFILSGCKTAPDKQIQTASPPPAAESPNQPKTSEAAAYRNGETSSPASEVPNSVRTPESGPIRKRETMPVADIQRRLRDLGYDAGPVDGKMGKGTIGALKKFQQENNLAVTGQADAGTVDRLRQQKAEPMAGTAMLTNTASLAEEVDPHIATCLKAWGNHPFGKSPKYTTLATSVMVFGIGQRPADTTRTDSPSLVLVNPGVNVMGGTTLELLNPNGWYCFRSNVNVMGGLNIRAHCKAHLASASNGATVLGSNSDNKSVTVLGSTHVELVGCEQQQ
jgi:peptidoglycan hydrolase-like protein with peptidoglycan-binding domain